LPRPKRTRKAEAAPAAEGASASVRPFWSGTLSFGLVNIPVTLYSAARPRQNAMKLVDKEGHALGRRYQSATDGEQAAADELIRGFETESGELVIITDAEFEAVAPETSRDIDLRMFVPRQSIPALYYLKPYYLAPEGRAAKAYHLLAQVMQRTGQVGIGSFVMRGHEYLVALIAEDGVLRAETLRYADEIRTPEDIGLPVSSAAPAKLINSFAEHIDSLTRDELDLSEFEDVQAQALRALAESKHKKNQDVVRPTGLEDEEAESESSGKVIDLMEVLRKSLSSKAVVSTARSPKRSDAARTKDAANVRRRAG
jgi:DNA end-binding protein Ku